MKKYIYETENMTFSSWSGKANEDYLNVLKERGESGWRFVTFIGGALMPKGEKGMEMLFEKEITD